MIFAAVDDYPELAISYNRHRTGQDRTGQDRTGQDRTGQDRTGQDRTGQDRTGQDRTGQDRTGQDRTPFVLVTKLYYIKVKNSQLHFIATVVFCVELFIAR